MSFKRNKPPEAPALPPMPAPVEIMDAIDEIGGFETVTILGQDGKKRRVTRSLPKSPEEQRLINEAQALINRSMTNIAELYAYDPASVIDYQPFIDTFTQINQERLNQLSTIANFGDIAQRVQQFRDISSTIARREFDRQSRMSEESLSRRGLNRSTAGAEQRAAMAAESALLDQQIDANALNYGEDLADKQLRRNASLYDIQEQGRLARLQEAEASHNLAQERQQELQKLRQNAIAENQSMLETARDVVTGDRRNQAQLALNASGNVNSLYATQAGDQMNRYNANVNRVLGQHKLDMDRWRAMPPTFGQRIGDLAMQSAGSWLSSPWSGGTNDSGSNSIRQNSGINSNLNSLKSWYANNQRDRAFNKLQQLGRG